MSETVVLQGFVAEIKRVPKEFQNDLEEFQEKLWDEDSALYLNYEGTLVYSDVVKPEGNQDFYGLTLGNGEDYNLEGFLKSLEKFEIEVERNSILKYRDICYNGADSSISMLTLEEFKQQVFKDS